MTTGQSPSLRLVTDDEPVNGASADVIAVDEAAIIDTDFDAALQEEVAVGRTANEPVDPSMKPDVIGLIAAAVWMVADEAKVSRGKVRRVLKAFEPMFWMRISEAYDTGFGTGYYQAQVDMQAAIENAEAASEEATKQLILPAGVEVHRGEGERVRGEDVSVPPGGFADEHANDPSGTKGRQESLSPEA